MSQKILLLLVCIILGAFGQTIHSYRFDSLTKDEPTYDLGYQYAGTTIQLNLTSQKEFNYDTQKLYSFLEDSNGNQVPSIII